MSCRKCQDEQGPSRFDGPWQEEPWPGDQSPTWWQRRVRQPVMDMIDDRFEAVQQGLTEDEANASHRYFREQEDILTGVFSLRRWSEHLDPPSWTLHKCPRFLTDQQVEEETDAATHVEFAFGDDYCHLEAPGSIRMSIGYYDREGSRVPRLSYNSDVLELRTRRFLWERMRLEQRDIAVNTFVLVFAQLCELVLGAAIIVLASPQFKGGHRMVMVSGVLSGCVMVLGSIMGMIGALRQNESAIRLFLTGTYWTMSVLTTLLYVEFDFFMDTQNECTSSVVNTASGGSTSCEEQRAEIAVLLILCAVGLGTTFICNFECYRVTDGLNDLTRISDAAMLLRYFQYRQHLLRERLMVLCGTRRQFGEAVAEGGSTAYGMLGTYEDISPAAVVALGMRDYKFTKYRCDAGPEDTRNVEPAQYDALVNPPWSDPGQFDEDAAQGAPQGI